MILTNCNCGEKLDCGCTLSFSSYISNPVSVLDIGSLIGGTCSLDAYVIDWYRNGEFYITSGEGGDDDINAFHPFTGTGAIPVPGGTYVPVLRYVVLSGQSTKLFPDKKECSNWCDFTNNLPEVIVVESLDCGKTNISGDYQYQMNYVSTQDYSLATRTLNWNLASDTKYFAFRFQAYTIADKIEIFKNEETTPIMAWIAGSHLNSNDISTMPYEIKGEVIQVLVMDTYTTGDYL